MAHAEAKRISHGTSRTVFAWVAAIGGFLLLTLALGLRADADELPGRASRTHDFNASGTIRSLSLENVNGDVTLTTGKSFTATVTVTAKAKTESAAKKALESTRVEFRNENGDLTLYTELPGMHVTRHGRGRGWSVHGDREDRGWTIETRVNAVIPADAEIDVSSVNGNVSSTGIAG